MRSSLKRISRDTILFVVGIGGIIYEISRNGAERPTLLIVLAGMAGLTQFMRRDEKHEEEKKEEVEEK